MKRLFCLAAIAAVVVGHSISAQAAGLEFAVGHTSDSTMTYRLGLQSDWDKSWWQSDVGRLTGYWSGAYTFWEGDERASVSSLSFSPVFVYEFAGESVKPYIEAGIGMALFSRSRVEDNNIGGAFQFEDRLGLGLRFAGGHQVGIRATHYSNAGISSRNDGVESYSLNYTMPL
ncbi:MULTISPECIES: acyloxyacyl hydrolase [Pseudomonas]|uniref:Lipid A deacylase n=1 Tax=Pseudomonas gessardii TaxID=78544 RepID=A0A7Y1QKS3_9PSED|nr:MULTISPECIES: acyloxyacyl hydrolase [Pseudomonas]MBH3425415.1 acyloxyacyl hydrolase [Pseudomonas gessardii]MCF4977711.1 acyloxyacyl hydrolase [Pseudomonas gessardii]MCF4991032.1 acyloxyacyl hydrolase [Pseudomonas gessardii]MCF5084181.1 acyloxyacyl hydrolase [Pseudomonas gessardii]MCF5095891.1 acyloxyacyl hydrolase [Pseudomonas gessardii]